MANVHYTLAISEEARDQLRALPKEWRKRIGDRLTALQNNLAGDVKKTGGIGTEIPVASGQVSSAVSFGR